MAAEMVWLTMAPDILPICTWDLWQVRGTLEVCITDGLNKIMTPLLAGHHLTMLLSSIQSMAEFSNNLRNDTDAYDFVRNLITQTETGRGGLTMGDLTDTDFANDAEF